MKRKPRKTLTLSQPSFLRKMLQDVKKRGPFLSLSENLKSFKHLLFCPSFVTEYGNIGGICWVGNFKNGRKNVQTEVFSRIQAAKFQVKASHSRTCTEERRQAGERTWDAVTMPGTGQTGEQTSNLLQQQNGHSDFRSQTPAWCLHKSSFLRVYLDLGLKGKGHILFFHNSLLHSNIKFTPSTSWAEDTGLCFKLKSISNDWPQCPEATWWQSREEWRTSKGLHNSSEIAPPAKEIRNKKISLVST